MQSLQITFGPLCSHSHTYCNILYPFTYNIFLNTVILYAFIGKILHKQWTHPTCPFNQSCIPFCKWLPSINNHEHIKTYGISSLFFSAYHPSYIYMHVLIPFSFLHSSGTPHFLPYFFKSKLSFMECTLYMHTRVYLVAYERV